MYPDFVDTLYVYVANTFIDHVASTIVFCFFIVFMTYLFCSACALAQWLFSVPWQFGGVIQ